MPTAKETSLSLLTSAALALPALASAAPDFLEDSSLDYQFSYYGEADGRMQARTHQLRGQVQATDSLQLNLDITRDTLSGASPMFNMPNNGKTVQVLSGASIREERNVISVGAGYKIAKGLLKLGVGRSDENDYEARFYSLGYGQAFNQKNTQVDFGLGVSLDRHGITGQDLNDKKHSVSYNLGITQLLSPASFIQTNLSYSQVRGSLSDPYKKVYIEGQGIGLDLRPDSRYQLAGSVLYAHHFDSNDSALHLSYRYYQDSWNIKAHTINLKYHLPVGKGWMLSPELRYYSQNQAEFYQSYFQAGNIGSYHSSDYRLSGFGAVTVGLSLRKTLTDKAHLELGWQNYRSSDAYRLGGSQGELPSPLRFNLFRLALKVEF